MGLFKSTKSLQEGDRFALVAQRITSAYLYIRDTYPQIGNPCTYLGAAGLNHATIYLKKKQIQSAQIIQMAKNSIQAGRDGVVDELESLGVFSRDLAVEYAQIDTGADRNIILQSYEVKRLAVWQTIQSTLRAYATTRKTGLMLRKGIDMFFSLSSMRPLVSQLIEETRDDWGHIAK